MLLSIEEAAEMLAIGRTTMYAYLRSGTIDSVRVGRRRYVAVAAVENFLAQLVASDASPEGS